MGGFKNMLWKLSSGDLGIIKKSTEKRLQSLFSLTGVLVLNNVALTFVSALIFFTISYGWSWVFIPLALFFAWMVSNIYLLLLLTLEENPLPHISENKYFKLSKILRYAAILFFALFISKPLEVVLFNKQVIPHLTTYKKNTLQDMESDIENIYADFISKNQALITKLSKDKILLGKNISEDSLRYANEITDYQNQIIKDKKIAATLVFSANYMVERIRIISYKIPLAWLVTGLICFLFLSPILIKEKALKNTSYYSKRREIETEMVLSQYQEFRKVYERIFVERFNVLPQNLSNYLDPPFNTRKKNSVNIYLHKDQLIDEIYGR
jgi:hypothetical protein